MAETKLYHLHRFNGQNYQLWKRQMEIFMVENKLKKYVDGSTVRPTEDAVAIAQWETKDAEAQAFLMRGLELDQLRFLTDCKTAAEMWGRLRTIHAEKSDQSVQVLLGQFINAKMETTESMADYIAKVTLLAQRLKDMDMEQKEPVIIAKIMSSLPEKYDNVRTAWYAVPKGEQRLDKLTDHLVNEEALLHTRDGTAERRGEEAYMARGKRSSGHNNNSRVTRDSESSRNNVKRGKCHFCHKSGHWARNCNEKRAYLENKNKNHSLLTENASRYDNNKGELFNVENSNNFDKEDVWYADSAASEHMCSNRELFESFHEINNESHKVKIGDGSLLVVVGIGDVAVKTRNSDGTYRKHTICNVWFVPGIKKNLLSIGRASERGMKVIFETGGKRVLFYKNNQLIVDGFRKNDNLYKLNFMSVNKIIDACVATTDTLIDWHEKLGHVNFQTLRQMISNSCVNDLNVCDLNNVDPFCEGCIAGKQHRNAFPKEGATRAKNPGNLFHADLCGKMSQSSIGGANYFLLLRDDFSRYCFVYFLKEKSDVLEALQKFYAEVQIEIKGLRTDRGKEFCNDNVEKFLISKRINHQYSTPRAPEQNGYIERMNRTIVESAKSMLHARQLPLYLWAEATATAVYVKNRTATNTLNGRTPYELWHGEKPSVAHLKIFGSTCYVHIPKDQRTKWESNTKKMMMIGYNSESKAYKVFDPVSRRCYVRRDVIFDERPSTDESIVIVKNDTDDIQERKKCEESPVRRNWRQPTLREPYPLRGRLHSATDSKQTADLKVAEAMYSACEPVTLEEAVHAEDSAEWIKAITEELDSLAENETWSLVERPEKQNVISNRWIFKKKYAAGGKIDKYKARLVARGFSQKEGVDFNEVFSPVAKYSTVRALLSIVAANNFEMIQFDIKTAFLHGDLEETIYMEQPYGFEIDDRVCLLKKSLYGLKQASKQWNKKIHNFFVKYGLIQSKQDACLYYCKTKNFVLYVVLYVDDGLICGNDEVQMSELLDKLSKVFKVKSTRAEFFVGMQIERDRELGILKVHQCAYVNRILERFHHENCSSLSIPADPNVKFVKTNETDIVEHKFPYREAIGSLMFLMVATRPDLAYIISVLSQFAEKPNKIHWDGVKRVFRYLKGTANLGITFGKTTDNCLSMYSDSDWAGDADTRRSTTGWISMLNGGPIAWLSQKQSCVTLSTTEAEFVALCSAAKETIYLRRLLNDLNYD